MNERRKRPSARARAYLWPLLVIAGSTLAGPTVHAATIMVTTTLDELNTDGDCSLREAIQSANTNLSADACVAGTASDDIVLPAGSYSLNRFGYGENANATGDLDITSDITITGASRDTTTINGLSSDRVLEIHSGATVTIRDVAIINGRTPTEPGTIGGGGDSADGGAIRNASVLTLERCSLTGNHTGHGGDAVLTPEGYGWGGSAGDGGAIWSLGTLTIIDCILANNSTGDGGDGGFVSGFSGGGDGGDGGAIYHNGALTIRDTAITGNTCGDWGDGKGPGNPGDAGGVYHVGVMNMNESLVASNSSNWYASAIYGDGTTNVTNTTIAGNSGSALRAVWIDSGNIGRISHSTIVENSSGGVGGPATISNSIVVNGGFDCNASVISGGHNIIGQGGGCLMGTNDQAIMPSTLLTLVLAPLADNGGPTESYAPALVSPALDSGTCLDVLGATVTVDQRGEDRPFGASCDRGAVESQNEIVPGPPLVEVTLEPPGANCANGGHFVQHGFDDNMNGVLDAVEITSTYYVCDGGNGAPGLVVTTDLPPGDANCEYGGVRIDSGVDDGAGAGLANDGVLHEHEIDATSYLCDGTDSHEPLIVQTPVPAGAPECEHGGVRIEVGLDLDRDGILSQDEVQSVEHVCNSSDGSDGLSSLIEQTALIPGHTTCAHGGQRIDIGLDEDRDGILDPEEIDSTSFVCQLEASGCRAGHGHGPGMVLVLIGAMWLAVRRRPFHTMEP